MPLDYLSLTEAAELSNKHRQAIRRFVEKIVKAGESDDRRHVRPSVEEYETIKARGRSFEWEVSKQIIEREYGPFQQDIEEGQGSASDDSWRALVQAKEDHIDDLRQQLDATNGQMLREQQQARVLAERLRESNVLLKQANDKYEQVPESIRESIESGKAGFWTRHREIKNILPRWLRKRRRANPADVPAASSQSSNR